MGKTVARIISVAALVAAFVVPGAGLFLSFTVFGHGIGASFLAISAISASIGFAKDAPGMQAARSLANNLSILSSPIAVRTVAFGRVGIAGQILFRENIENSGDTPDELLLILGLAGYPATSLEEFWFNGENVFSGESTTGPGAITTGVFANDLWVWFRTGEETSDAFPDIAALSPAWAARTRILRGIPSIGIRLRVTEKVEGRLEPLAQIMGAKLYDPRLDSTVPGGSGLHRFADPLTWEWSENPKLAELLYLRGAEVNGVRIFGMGKPAAAIDLENFASEANICEEQILVVGGGTINRYTSNGLLHPGSDHRTNLMQLLSASAGTMDASGGIYRTFAGAWRAPSMTLTEQDIDGAPTEIRLQKNPSEEVNIIIGSFADPVDQWEVKEYPERRDQASIDQVGENPITLDLPFTNDHRICQRIAKIEMHRQNARRHFGATYWLRTIPLQPGDIVTQTYSRYAINSETFRVNFWALQAAEDRHGAERLVVPMQLVEERQEWFDWDEATEEQQTSTITPLPTMDRRPKLITLDGVPTFEGSLPPANPKVGWLWRDTDTNILFRWSGSAWVDYATDTKTADQIDYLSGASVESLEPAEAAADVTAPRLLGNGLINPGAETGTLDGWGIATGTWSASAAEPRFGTYSLEAAVSTGTLQIPNNSQLQVSEGDRVLAMAFVKRTGSAGAEARAVKVRVRFLDSAGSLVGAAVGNDVTNTAYELSRVIATAPAGAVSAQFTIRSEAHSGDTQGAHADGAYMAIIPRNLDIDSLLTENGPAEPGADVTGNNADDVIFRQATAPANPQVGWLWEDTDIEVVFRWDGSAWIEFSDISVNFVKLASAYQHTAIGALPQTAAVTFMTDGQVQDNDSNIIGKWWSRAPEADIGDGFQVRLEAILTNPFDINAAAEGTWVTMTSDRTWGVIRTEMEGTGSDVADGNFEIREVGSTTIEDECIVHVEAADA